MPPFTRFTWIDEVLAGAARYDILENGGGAFKANMQINLATGVSTPGSTFTAARLNNIESEIQALSDFLQYKFSVTVVSNDLVVTIQHADDTNPTSTRPLFIRIGGIWRSITTTTTITIADGTNWFNSGSAELGTKLVGYFAYAVWDSNSSVVALTISRIPFARLVSDFHTTTTNEKHCFNFSNFTSTDPVANIGYFEATLSLSGTSHLWTVPTFTNANLKHEPTFETNVLSWTPVWSANGSMTYTTITTQIANYQIISRKLNMFVRSSGTIGGTPNTNILCTAPFSSVYVATANEQGPATGDSVVGRVFIASGTPNTLTFQRYDIGNWTAGSRIAAGVLNYWI